jgi:hypothetical protein
MVRSLLSSGFHLFKLHLNFALTTSGETQTAIWEASKNYSLSNTVYGFRNQYNDCNSAFVPLKVEDISPCPHEDDEMSAYPEHIQQSSSGNKSATEPKNHRKHRFELFHQCIYDPNSDNNCRVTE